MSGASPFRYPWSDRRARGLQFLVALVVEPLRFTAFWSAVTLPFVLLALVFSNVAAQRPQLFAGLLGANLVALRLGRDYKRE